MDTEARGGGDVSDAARTTGAPDRGGCMHAPARQHVLASPFLLPMPIPYMARLLPNLKLLSTTALSPTSTQHGLPTSFVTSSL
jgi:hypothetical protein